MNLTKPTSTKNKLDTVTALFQQWRSQSAGHRTEPPTELRVETLSLLQDYSRSQIVTALGINHTMLKQWQAAALSTDTGSPFISLPVTAASPHAVRELTLAFGNGSQATLRGDFSLAELTTLLRGLGTATETRA